MAEAFSFELVSPERLLVSEPVAEVVVPGSEGDFTVLKGHAPFMSTIRPGFIEVKKDGAAASRIFVRGGFADVSPKGLTVLAEQAIPEAELNADKLAAAVKNAEEDLADAKTDDARQAAAEKLAQLKDVAAALAR